MNSQNKKFLAGRDRTKTGVISPRESVIDKFDFLVRSFNADDFIQESDVLLGKAKQMRLLDKHGDAEFKKIMSDFLYGGINQYLAQNKIGEIDRVIGLFKKYDLPQTDHKIVELIHTVYFQPLVAELQDLIQNPPNIADPKERAVAETDRLLTIMSLNDKISRVLAFAEKYNLSKFYDQAIANEYSRTLYTLAEIYLQHPKLLGSQQRKNLEKILALFAKYNLPLDQETITVMLFNYLKNNQNELSIFVVQVEKGKTENPFEDYLDIPVEDNTIRFLKRDKDLIEQGDSIVAEVKNTTPLLLNSNKTRNFIERFNRLIKEAKKFGFYGDQVFIDRLRSQLVDALGGVLLIAEKIDALHLADFYFQTLSLVKNHNLIADEKEFSTFGNQLANNDNKAIQSYIVKEDYVTQNKLFKIITPKELIDTPISETEVDWVGIIPYYLENFFKKLNRTSLRVDTDLPIFTQDDADNLIEKLQKENGKSDRKQEVLAGATKKKRSSGLKEL